MKPSSNCTCPSGDGSLRHPCPEHPATLATAKHGGCVQLATVPYDRARELIGDAYNAGTHGIGYSQQIMELHDAVVAAQSSPGGQGAEQVLRRALQSAHDHGTKSAPFPMADCIRQTLAALAARQPVGLAEALQHYMRDESDKLPDEVFNLPQEAQRALVTLSGLAASPMRIHPSDAKEAVEYVIAALLNAARQPDTAHAAYRTGKAIGRREAELEAAARQTVGEPVAYRNGDEFVCAEEWATMRALGHDGNGWAPLYAAPPAQAVDLGRYYGAIEFALGHLNGDDEPEYSQLRELLDLIDSKVVGNG